MADARDPKDFQGHRKYVFLIHKADGKGGPDRYNKPEELMEVFKKWVPRKGAIWNIRHVIFTEENTPKDGLHLQGCVRFSETVRRDALRSHLKGVFLHCYLKYQQDSDRQPEDYRKKSEFHVQGPFEFGKLLGRGYRSDFEDIVSIIKGGGGLKEVIEKHPRQYIRYHSGIEKLLALSGQNQQPPSTSWQQDLLKELDGEPDECKIIWYVDTRTPEEVASFVCRIKDAHPGDVWAVGKGNPDNMIGDWTGQRICLLDFSGPRGTKFHYHVAEALKDGIVGAGYAKYGTGARRYNRPHVVCFSSIWPDLSMMSAHKWDIRKM